MVEMQGNGIKINPHIFEWALRNSGVDYDFIISKFPHFAKWMAGELFPTFTQLTALSKSLHFPLGYFFLLNPMETESTADFRTIQNKLVSDPSPNLKITIHDMKEIQEWQRDYCIKYQLEKISFILPDKEKNKFTSNLKKETTILSLILTVHKILDIPQKWFLSFKSTRDAFKYLRNKIESKRIIVVLNGKVGNNTHRVLDVNEFRAFTIYDDYAPLIFLNNSDSETGLIFSLLHEFFHILFSETDIIKNHNYTGTETLCNRAAIEFLAPKRYIKEEWAAFSNITNIEKIYRLASKLKISEIALAYRVKNLKLISSEELVKIERYQEEKSKSKITSGGNYWNTKFNVLSKHLVQSIIADIYAGNTSYTEGFSLLGIKNGKQLRILERGINNE